MARIHDHLHAIVLLVPERPVHPGRIVKRHPVRDDKRRINLAALDAIWAEVPIAQFFVAASTLLATKFLITWRAIGKSRTGDC
jgi:hypothetical protein